MANRKATPDVLGEVLAAAAAPVQSPPAAPAGKVERLPPAQPSPAPSPAQPVWEYRTVVFRDYRGLRPRRVDGTELADWKTQPTLHDYLNQVGQQGWELVSLLDQRSYEKEGVFKRQKL